MDMLLVYDDVKNESQDECYFRLYAFMMMLCNQKLSMYVILVLMIV